MKKILLLLLFFGLLKHGNAQAPDIKFEHIGVKDGLPEQQIQSLKQDAQGYIWIGTQNGLVRYDGYNYKIYSLGAEKKNKFHPTDVQSIFEDKQKTLWISTIGNGIFRYDRNTDTFKQFELLKLPGLSVVFICFEDNNNNLWCREQSGTSNGSYIIKFNKSNGSYETFDEQKKGTGNINVTNSYNPFITADGTIWVPTNNGLYKYNGPGKGFKSYFTTTDTTKTRGFNPVYEAPSEPGVLWANTFHSNNKDLRITRFDFRNNTIKDYYPGNKPGDVFSAYLSAIYEDHKKQLWFSLDSGMARFNRKTGTFTNYFLKDKEKTSLAAISETAHGNFWISATHGLVYFNTSKGEFKQYRSDGAPPFINNKIIDNTGQLWVGTYGIYKANYLRSAFHTYTNQPGKNNSYPGGPLSIALAGNGNYWLYNNTTVYKWLTATGEFIKTFSGDVQINSMCQGENNIIYIATTTNFIAYNTQTHKQEVYKHSDTDTNTVSGISVRSIYCDHAGIIWLGTYRNGLCSFNPQTKKITRYPYRVGTFINNFVNDGRLDDSNVGCIYESPDNTLWVGTNAGGLNKFDRATNKFFSYANIHQEMFCVIAICAADSGRIWAGTYLSGLFELDPKNGKIIKSFTEKSGLLHNQIEALSKDAAGNIWILSDRGLTRYNPKTNSLQNFKASTILPGDNLHATQGIEQSRSGNGMIAVSLDNGIAMFDPKALDANINPPIVHVEGITYSNPLSDESAKTIVPYGINKLELAYNQNRLKFDYIALHFDDPSQNKYAYKLDGYDKDWIQAGTLRSVTYTNLSPGTYTFHVKACNSDGIWNNKGDSITIIIHTSLWMRWWAWVIYIVLFAAAIYAFVGYRSRALKRENQVLEEKINERTQQLSNANKELSEQQEEIITQRDRLSETVEELKTTQQQLIQSEKLASLGELTAGIAHEIQNPLNFVNNFSEINMELIDEMREELDKGDKDEAITLSEDIKQNLEKIRHHGKRADAIVKNMLQHSRNNSNQREPTDINALADEYFRLSYHGLRAKDKSFNSEMVTELGENIPKVDIVPQDIGRVLLNLFNNSFYAVQQKKKALGDSYKPEVKVSTTLNGDHVEIKVKDNGIGIPDAVKEKILQPFFTTKPTGEGTGLGLSLSYDIVVKGHGGKLDIHSREGEGSEFIISMPT